MSKSNTPIFVLNSEVQFQILRLNLKFGLHTQVCFIHDLIQTGFTVIMKISNTMINYTWNKHLLFSYNSSANNVLNKPIHILHIPELILKL